MPSTRTSHLRNNYAPHGYAKHVLRPAWGKAISQAAASCTEYEEAGRSMLVAQEKEKESIASCEAAIDYYNKTATNYESEDA